MTPQDVLDLEQASETIRKIVDRNNGNYLMLASTPPFGVPPYHFAKLNMQGDKDTLIENLKLAAEQNPQLSTLIRSATFKINLANIEGAKPKQISDKEAEIFGHIDQLLDMQENYPEIGPNLQLFVNHLKGLLNCLRQKVAS